MLGPLDSYLWKSRLLVLFAPSARDARLLRQERAIRNETRAMRERDLRTIVVLPHAVSQRGGAASPKGLDPIALRRRYHVREGDFRVLLIGKDGGVKRTSAVPVSLRSIFDEIDAMPMRQDEARERGQGPR